jgi:hypothetical protein
MTIDMEQIGIIANSRDDVLVPDFGQQRAAGLFPWPVLPLPSLAAAPAATRVLHGSYSGLGLPPSKHGRLPFDQSLSRMAAKRAAATLIVICDAISHDQVSEIAKV